MGARECADNRNRGKQRGRDRERQGEKRTSWIDEKGDVLQTEEEKDVYWRDEKEELTGT